VPSRTALTTLIAASSSGNDWAIGTGQKIITQDLARMWELTPVLFKEVSLMTGRMSKFS